MDAATEDPWGFLLSPPDAEVFPQGCLPASAALWVVGWKVMIAVPGCVPSVGCAVGGGQW